LTQFFRRALSQSSHLLLDFVSVMLVSSETFLLFFDSLSVGCDVSQVIFFFFPNGALPEIALEINNLLDAALGKILFTLFLRYYLL